MSKRSNPGKAVIPQVSAPGSSKRAGHDKYAQRIEKFCLAYVIDLNGAKAAIAAGYSAKGAEVRASELLRKRKVRDRIAELTKKHADKLEITAERVLQELASLAFLDPRKFFDETGTLKRIVDLDDATAASIAGFEGTDYGMRIKFVDKGVNLERLGRYLKLFVDQVAVSGLEGLPEAIQEARARAGSQAEPEAG